MEGPLFILPFWIASAAELGPLRGQGAPLLEVIVASTSSAFKQVCGSVAGVSPSQGYPGGLRLPAAAATAGVDKGSAAVVWIQIEN
jgi:hypothetical protein